MRRRKENSDPVTILRRLRRYLILALALFIVVPTFLVSLYGIVRPPITPLMVIRLFEGEGLERRWRPLERISPELARAVISAEDTRFCLHAGFDWEAIEMAFRKNLRGERLYGGSTISMQTAKNLFLWPGRSILRKGLEAYLTLLLEALLDKRRILEIYLNTVEWGHGVYGAEAAAQTHFGKPAADLTRREAALLAAVLPNPRRWLASKPSAYARARAATIEARMRAMPAAELCID
jgi:monofunctional biosynthetic peptidoglycan transglycosylase